MIQKIRAEIERRITDNTFGAKLELIDILAWLDTLEEEPVEDLKEAVEGEVILSHGQKVIEHKGSVGIQESSFPNMNGFSVGDKVFIIITK